MLMENRLKVFENRKVFLQSYQSLLISIKNAEELVVLLSSEQRKYTAFLLGNDDCENYDMEIKSLIADLGKMLNEKNQICKRILLKIDQMNCETEKNILTLKYISGYTWEQISEITNYSLRQVYNIHNKALNHINA